MSGALTWGMVTWCAARWLFWLVYYTNLHKLFSEKLKDSLDYQTVLHKGEKPQY